MGYVMDGDGQVRVYRFLALSLNPLERLYLLVLHNVPALSPLKY